ncbi:hypothetical protein [Marinobacterium mangrovicola]|uniref:hypothetical protein n=1 Tax=Marinobacterium mangrovicola TaxID=1476959 RepID=UPI0014044BCD|nr:hypothetical protein [Marinobacterium mangrovicola]
MSKLGAAADAVPSVSSDAWVARGIANANSRRLVFIAEDVRLLNKVMAPIIGVAAFAGKAETRGLLLYNSAPPI